MGYNQHLSAISGGCEALTAGSPAALKLGRPRPKMPSKGPGSTRVAMENQPNLHQDVSHVHLAMMAVSTFLICSFFHKGMADHPVANDGAHATIHHQQP